jgi:ArsR family metal-binding transcriptional regulator
VDVLTTFSRRAEFERAAALLRRLRIAHRVVSPDPGFAEVGTPAVVLSPESRSAFLDGGGGDIVSVGWVDYRSPTGDVPCDPPHEFPESPMGRVAIVVLAPCIADAARLRLIAHFSGDVAEALPYLNAEVLNGSYVPTLPVFTFMDGHRMVSLFRDRIGIAKADDVVDAWASLERARCLVGDIWARRAEIIPSSETRRRPPALEIYKRLPGTNCGECGEATCMAFAWGVWRGDLEPSACAPVFDGRRAELKDALLAICAGLGLRDPFEGTDEKEEAL